MSPTLRSPRYGVFVPKNTLPAGGSKHYDFADIPSCARELPYNNIVIRNFSGQRYKVEYGDTTIYLGGYEVFMDDAAYGTRSITITNTSGVNQDDDISIIVSREISATAALVAGLTGANLYQIANGGGVGGDNVD